MNAPFAAQPLTRAEVGRFVRSRLGSHLYDATGSHPTAIAVYTLSDPRDLRAPRYVGQTRSPRRRYFQHVGTARLWMPDELPWWIVEEKQRPLYEWIRALYRDEQRLPVMVVSAWHGDRAHATVGERELIQDCLRQRMPLLNIESAVLQAQLRLL